MHYNNKQKKNLSVLYSSPLSFPRKRESRPSVFVKRLDSRFRGNDKCARTGMSLIETLVYVAVLGLISIFITNSLIKIVGTYRQAQAEREVLSNARLMMETVTKNIAYSREVYAPTSIFNSATSQISLITPLDTLPEHTTTYLDFWSDGNRLLMREEGKATTTLSSATVQVAQFRAERIVQGLGREAIKITLNVVSKTLPQAASTTLNATTALRGNY